jgi:hypothetical protein
MNRRGVTLPLLCALVAALASPWAAAQYDEDAQTRDHEEQDRLYRERHAKPDQPPPPAENSADAEDQRDAYLSRADELIRDRNYRAGNSARYRVQTDDPRLDTREALVLLESFRDYFDGFWGERVELARYDRVSRVFLFYSFHKFNELMETDFRFSVFRPKGHYRTSLDVITLHTDADETGNVADALIHEAAHQLVEQRINPAGHPNSPWVSEGLANYFGFTYRDETGRFRPGLVGGKSSRLFRDAGKPGTEGRAAIQRLRRLFKEKNGERGGPVGRVIAIRDPARFYSEDAPAHYGVSWLLVHYLLHGKDGAHADAFVAYLGREAEGRGGPDALYALIDLEPAELEAAVRNHLKGLKSRP